jgi:hypothetical protein
MARRKRRSKTKTNNPSLKYFIGIMLLICTLGLGVYFQANQGLVDVVTEYANHKQEVADNIGKIESISNQNTLRFLPKDGSKKFAVTLVGSQGTADLLGSALYKDKSWQLKNLQLKTIDKTISLSQAYVIQVNYFAASPRSAPLKQPTFLEDEDAFIHLKLKGVGGQKNIHIDESLTIYDGNNDLVATAENIASYRQPSSAKTAEGISFTNKIASLKPGKYFVRFGFKDSKSVLETYWQTIHIKAAKNLLRVTQLKYYRDELRSQQNRNQEFTTKNPVFLRMRLGGFANKEQKLAGTVDLQITNSQGKTIAFKPKFAKVNQTYAPNKDVVIDGKFKITEADIYFLTFKIRDHLAKQEITHEEKIIVSLP